MSHYMYPIRNFHVPVRETWGFTEPEGEGPVIGLEFENELLHPVDFGSIPGWKYHSENSLRNFGYEFVTTKPMTRNKTEKSVQLLFNKIQTVLKKFSEVTKLDMEPSNSIRTSVHVHLDARKWNYIQVLNFALVYWLLEDFLTSYCGETRRGNLFCLRMRDAAFQKHNVNSELKNMTPYGSSAFTDSQRYASLNLAAIRKFGSLESRLLRGTTDINVVMTWVDCLLAIYNYSLKFKTPKDIQKDFLNECDAMDYPAHVLGFGLSQKMKGMMEVLPSPQEIAGSIRENYVELVDLFSVHETFDFTEEAKKQDKELETKSKEQAEFYNKTLTQLKKSKKILFTEFVSAPTAPSTGAPIPNATTAAPMWAVHDELEEQEPLTHFEEPEPEQEESDF